MSSTNTSSINPSATSTVEEVSERDAHQNQNWLRGSFTPALLAVGYLIALTVAEATSTLLEPRIGLTLHAITLVALIIHGVFTDDQPTRGLLLTLSFAPLIRVLSYALPLASFPTIDWYVLTSVPLFVAAFLSARALGLTRRELGLIVGYWPIQGAVAVSGLLLGYVEYRILRPEPLVSALTVPELWLPALILLVCTGFLEELLFRGLLQRTAMGVVGRFGILYVAILFAVLHLGYHSALDVLFVLGVGLYFGWVVARTGSLLGVTLAHGLTNILLFLIVPLTSLAMIAPAERVIPVGTPLASVPTLIPGARPVALATPRITPSPAARPTMPASAASPTQAGGAAASGARVRVATDALRVRGGPGVDYPALGMVWRDQTYAVVGRDATGDWVQVCCPVDGAAGWLSTELVESVGNQLGTPIVLDQPTPTVTASLARVMVVFERLNVRGGPGIQYPTLAEAHLGDQFTVLGRDADEDWWKVCCVAGNEGWVSGRYIQIEGDADQVPIELGPAQITSTPTAPASDR